MLKELRKGGPISVAFNPKTALSIYHSGIV